jgi:hypothetical protein
MRNKSDKRALLDEYRVPGFKTLARVEGCEKDFPAFIITLKRRQKKRRAADVERFITAFMTAVAGVHAISIAASAPFILILNGVVRTARRAA